MFISLLLLFLILKNLMCRKGQNLTENELWFLWWCITGRLHYVWLYIIVSYKPATPTLSKENWQNMLYGSMTCMYVDNFCVGKDIFVWRKMYVFRIPPFFLGKLYDITSYLFIVNCSNIYVLIMVYFFIQVIFQMIISSYAAHRSCKWDWKMCNFEA